MEDNKINISQTNSQIDQYKNIMALINDHLKVLQKVKEFNKQSNES